MVQTYTGSFFFLHGSVLDKIEKEFILYGNGKPISDLSSLKLIVKCFLKNLEVRESYGHPAIFTSQRDYEDFRKSGSNKYYKGMVKMGKDVAYPIQHELDENKDGVNKTEVTISCADLINKDVPNEMNIIVNGKIDKWLVEGEIQKGEYTIQCITLDESFDKISN